MMQRKPLIALIVTAVALSLVGCNKGKTISLEADQAQIGAGSTLSFTEGETGGQLVIQGPKVLTEAVKSASKAPGVNVGSSWTVTTASNKTLSFTAVAGHWKCTNCPEQSIPTDWHAVEKAAP